MAAITLAQATEQRDAALAALQAARRAVGYSVGDQSVRRPELEQLSRDLQRWERTVAELTAVAAGVTNPGYAVASWD